MAGRTVGELAAKLLAQAREVEPKMAAMKETVEKLIEIVEERELSRPGDGIDAAEYVVRALKAWAEQLTGEGRQ